jgi:hypothetical protein
LPVSFAETTTLGVPKVNLAVFSYLYCIETVLRELIVEVLEPIAGPRWYRTRLPGDVLAKYREAIAYQRRTPWQRLQPHHPVYYIDFPDLRKIIERDDNWRDAFDRIFVRKDAIASTLSELEPVRNAIAHNRRLLQADVAIAEAAYRKLLTAVGQNRFDSVLTRSTAQPDIVSQLLELKAECNASLAACLGLQELPPLQYWKTVSSSWWFDSTYLGHPLDPVADYFASLAEYSSLPRHRGQGHLLEQWVASGNLSAKHGSALAVIGLLVGAS